MALLQRLLSDRRPVGHFSSPEDEAVRFYVNPRFGFPASEIQQLEVHNDAPADMMVNFMGLTGPQGVLPYVYSEMILERMRAKDRTIASFFDIFNHRAISLFYRAWQRTRFPVNYASGTRDYFSQYLRDLLGLGTAGLRDRQEIEDEALMHYISLIAMQSRSAVALEQVLADYFEVPVEIQQFTGAWYTLDQSTQCAMNEKDSMSTQIGAGAVVGDAVWDRQGRVRIRIGPIGMDRYNDFLPGRQRPCGIARHYRILFQRLRGFRSATGARSQRGSRRRTRFERQAPGASGLGVVGQNSASGRRPGRHDSCALIRQR